MTDWQVYLQDQPSQCLDEIADTDRSLFSQVTIALTQLSDASGSPLDEWGDLRSVVFTSTVTAEVFVNPEARAIDVVPHGLAPPRLTRPADEAGPAPPNSTARAAT